MFEKTLSDVVKGIRASKRDTGLYISACIAEIKTELSSTDLYVKANALQKLTFLQMMGYSMTWASFATIEVMSSPRFAHKRVGYLAASQGFTQDTEVILLTTNLLKKELRGAVGVTNMQGVYEAGLAINCISNIVTEDLARDLLSEVTQLTRHSQPYIRKKATLCLFKLFLKYPQGLRLAFPTIQQALDDNNAGVVSCAVNVITELSDKNPTNYLHLAPAFFALLTNSTNNWMLIKVVKLLGSLVPEEPRLARKLLEPLAQIVRSTQAKSLLFEAVHTLTLSLPYCRKSDGSMPASVPDIVTLCAATLRNFVQEEDANLKYLGLVGFGSLMVYDEKVISAPEYRPLILKCLSDDDVTIRTRALDLLKGMASRKNLHELVSQLLTHVEMATGSYKNDLVEKILEMCSEKKYALLNGDFEWYLNILQTLVHLQGIEVHGELLKHQVTDVALRVLPVRPLAVQQSMQVLTTASAGGENQEKQVMKEILPAFAWTVGEYSDCIKNVDGEYRFDASCQGNYHSLVKALVSPSNIDSLPTTTQSVYVQAALKVFAAATADSKVSSQELEACVETLTRYLPVYMESTDVEVQERAFTANELLRSLNLTSSIGDVPGLAKADSDEEDDSADDDLLGMTQGSKPSSRNRSGSSLAAHCRGASETLNYILKPEPMKPTGAKAQRKKRQSPIGVDVSVIDAPINLDVFSSFIQEELSQRGTSNISIESVSFTQQRPLRAEPSRPAVVAAALDMSSVQGEMPQTETSFQHSGMPELTEGSGFVTQQLNRQQQDPFYLDSGAAMESEHIMPSRFGTIQLTDSDGHESHEGTRKRKKKKKKKHQKESAQSTATLGDADFSMLTGTSTAPSVPQASATGLANVTIYTSDEDDDDDDDDHPRHGKKTGPAKEYEGLAKVDLTTPLREDEVMPERQHRVVPERKTASSNRGLSKKQKKKEDKKQKKKSKQVAQEPSGGGVCDLLDLGGFMPVADVSSEVVAASPKGPTASQSGNAISAAFDDLLSLSAPVPVDPLSSTMQSSGTDILGINAATDAAPPSKGKRAWLKATIKASRAEGSPIVDWTKVNLTYRVHQKKDGSATVTCRLENHMSTTPLQDVVLKLKGQADINIGTVEPQQMGESQKSSPMSYGQAEASVDLKGSLVTAECTVPVKMALPATHFLNPLPGLTQDDIMSELSSSQWPSHSAKLEAVENPSKIKPIICSFLHAAEVDGGSSPLMGTMASQSLAGAKVFFLVKIMDSTVKMDIRSTDEALCKSLATDLKKLVL